MGHRCLKLTERSIYVSSVAIKMYYYMDDFVRYQRSTFYKALNPQQPYSRTPEFNKLCSILLLSNQIARVLQKFNIPNLIQSSQTDDFDTNFISPEDSLLNMLIDTVSSKRQEILLKQHRKMNNSSENQGLILIILESIHGKNKMKTILRVLL